MASASSPTRLSTCKRIMPSVPSRKTPTLERQRDCMRKLGGQRDFQRIGVTDSGSKRVTFTGEVNSGARRPVETNGAWRFLPMNQARRAKRGGAG